MRKYLAEFIGTFALIFAGCGAIAVNELGIGQIGSIGVSAVFGLIVMVMIYSYGDVSGAHFNPAVTAAFFAARRINAKDTVFYVLFQTMGAICAALLLKAFFPEFESLGTTDPSFGVWQSFAMEVIITLILMSVILNVSTGHFEKGITAGMAIGATVALCAIFAGPVSGASMNPARSFGPALASGDFSNIWIYITAPFLGALFAVPFSKHIRKNNKLAD